MKHYCDNSSRMASDVRVMNESLQKRGYIVKTKPIDDSKNELVFIFLVFTEQQLAIIIVVCNIAIVL